MFFVIISDFAAHAKEILSTFAVGRISFIPLI